MADNKTFKNTKGHTSQHLFCYFLWILRPYVSNLTKKSTILGFVDIQQFSYINWRDLRSQISATK